MSPRAPASSSHRPMTRTCAPQAWSRPLASVSLALGIVLVLVTGAAAQTSEFPWPLVGPILPTDQPPALDIRSVSIEQIDIGTTAVVRFAAGFEVPTDSYRVSVVAGDEGDPQRRVSLTIDGGVQAGSIEQFVDGAWEVVDETGVQVAPAGGEVLLSLPEEALGDSPLVWVEAQSGSDLVVSPLFLQEDLAGQQAMPVVGLSSSAWLASGDPSQGVVDLGGVPEITLVDSRIEVTYPGATPTSVAGSGVSRLIDVVKISPGFGSVSDAPYWITIDHTSGQVSLLDATVTIPAEVDGGDAWLVDGIPTGGVAAGTVLTFDLQSVLDAFGVTASDDSTGMGLARSVSVDDGSEYRSDGAIGTLGWFRGEIQTVVATTAASVPDSVPAGVDQAAVDSSGSNGGTPWGWTLLLVLLVGGGAAAVWFFVLRYRHAYRPDDLMVEPVPRQEPTDEEREALEDLNRQLFGE